MNLIMNIIYSLWSIHLIMQLYINNTYGFLHHNTLIKCNKYIKSSVQDYQYEYQIDWNSGEVPWDFIELDNVLYNQDNNINIPVPATIDIEVVMPDRSMDSTIVINTDFDNIMITKAIVSGVMKGIYIQIVSIDNMITYTQCYTNKVIDMDIVLSLLYVILYETNKVNEKNNIIILKKYNNIQLFEKYIKLRRNSMILIIIMYVLLFREISNVE